MITYGKAYKFVDYAAEVNPWEPVEGTEMSKETQEYYFTGPSAINSTVIKKLGWAVPVLGLSTYVVKDFHTGGWTEHVSPNKTLLRKKLGSHNIIKIVEVK